MRKGASRSSAFAMECGLDFLDGAGDEIIDGLHRFHRELGRREAVHQDLKGHGQEGPTYPMGRPTVAGGPITGRATGARPVGHD